MSFISYELYEDPRGEHSDDGSVTAAEYLKSTDMSFEPTEGGYGGTIHSLFHLPGERFPVSVSVATEEGKLFAKSLLQNLWDIEQIGECLGPFDESKIRVRNGRSLFHNVERRDLDPKQLDANYVCARKIIEDAFTRKGATVPKDIEHLLNMIKNEPSNIPLFRVHASLWPLSIRGSMCIRLYEHLKTLSGVVSYEVLCEMGRLKYISTWRTSILQNTLLEQIYFFETGKYNKNHNLKGQTAIDNSEGKLFTDFLRHRVAHRMDIYDATKPHTAHGSELTALIRWPTALPTLQCELYKCKKTGDLNIGELY